jgi:dTDP-4-dehydrorhamnose reductase
MVVLVTGGSGQLGQSLQFIAVKYPNIQFEFFNSSLLDVTNFENCDSVFSKIKPDYCINASAYTAVDKAESEPEKAYDINVLGAENLAVICKKYNTILIHVSTDFVFDGEKNIPYNEKDITNPLSVYGKTKFDGEKAIQSVLKEHLIIRTSWLYSQFSNNFMKTMLRLASERDSLSIVNDQIGTPTYAVDLAEVIIKIIILNTKSKFGIYHYSNEGQCSWFDFAKKIFEYNSVSIQVNPIPSSSFPTPAKRPKYSVLDKSKIKNAFGIEIPNWEVSLKKITH